MQHFRNACLLYYIDGITVVNVWRHTVALNTDSEIRIIRNVLVNEYHLKIISV